MRPSKNPCRKSVGMEIQTHSRVIFSYSSYLVRTLGCNTFLPVPISSDCMHVRRRLLLLLLSRSLVSVGDWEALSKDQTGEEKRKNWKRKRTEKRERRVVFCSSLVFPKVFSSYLQLLLYFGCSPRFGVRRKERKSVKGGGTRRKQKKGPSFLFTSRPKKLVSCLLFSSFQFKRKEKINQH